MTAVPCMDTRTMHSHDTTPPPLAPDERDLLGFDFAYAERAETSECCPKDTLHLASPFGSEGCDRYEAETRGDLSLLGRDPLSDTVRKRRSPASVPWFDKREVDGFRVSRSLRSVERAHILDAWDRAPVLRMPLVVHLSHKDSALDTMGPVQRMRSWDRVLQRYRSHAAWRRRSTGRPFPAAFIFVRESDPHDHEGEHGHLLCHAPDDDEAERLIRLAAGWSDEGHAQDADHDEVVRDGKVISVGSYVTKASPSAAWSDPTMLYRRSGAVVGPRFRVSTNLTSPAAIREAEIVMQAKQRVREERGRLAWRARHSPIVSPVLSTSIIKIGRAHV